MLAAGEGNPGAMHGVPADHVKDFGIFFARGPKGTSACGHVVEQILNRDLRSSTTCRSLGRSALPWLRRNQFSITVMRPPRTT